MTAPSSRLLRRLGAHDSQLLLRLSLTRDAAPVTRGSWIIITHLGSAVVVILAVLLPPILGLIPPNVGWRAAAALTGSHAIVQLMKRSIHRGRPGQSAHIPFPDEFSFPSGHAASSLAVTMSFSLAYPEWAPLLMPLGALVGWSRVVLGVHYPGDVLAGQLIAALSVALSQLFIN